MARGESHYSLDDQAISLVQELRDTPDAEREKELTDWCRRSPGHARAVERAKKLLSIAQSLPADISRPSDRWVVPLQTRWLRLQENAFRLPYVLAASLVIAALLYVQLPRDTQTEVPANAAAIVWESVEYETARGQVREIALDDGSTLWLDWRSRATVLMDADRRAVSLHKGSAVFDVAGNDLRPFVVDAAGVTTRVTGTEFAVRHVDDGGVEVAVLEGSVNVDAASADGAVELAAGQTVLGKNGSLGEIARRPVEELGAWRDGMLIFTDRPLLDALRTLQPYTSYRLETERLLDAGQKVTGTFPIDRADASLRTLLVNHSLDAELIAPNTLVLRHSLPARPR